MATGLYCTFKLGDLTFAIASSGVQEISKGLGLAEVPLASQLVSGLINLRGQVVTAINLRSRLDLPEPTRSKPFMNVFARHKNEVVGLIVDEIGDVLSIDPEEAALPPETLQGEIRKLIVGVVPMEDRLIMLLDLNKALEVAHGHES